MEKFEYRGYEILVHKAYGWDDDYYWEKTFLITINGEYYILFMIGSGSGYIATDNSLKKADFDFLNNRKKEGCLSFNDFQKDTDLELSNFDRYDFENLFDYMLLKNVEEVSSNGMEYFIVQ